MMMMIRTMVIVMVIVKMMLTMIVALSDNGIENKDDTR